MFVDVPRAVAAMLVIAAVMHRLSFVQRENLIIEEKPENWGK